MKYVYNFIKGDSNMETLIANKRTYKINFIPFEDKCGLNEDGTYDVIYRGKYIELHCEKEELLNARIYDDSNNQISFFFCPFTIFGKDLENVKKYFQEKHGIREFQYFDSDKCYVTF